MRGATTAMPVGIQRLNARRTQPNPNIVFIKPLPGPDSSTAEKFLERIAAQCRALPRQSLRSPASASR